MQAIRAKRVVAVVAVTPLLLRVRAADAASHRLIWESMRRSWQRGVHGTTAAPR